MQSFAFDSLNRKLFTCTLLENGNNRDLAIHRVSIASGAPINEPMIVRNAGHGIAFGVEGIGTDSYVWIEQLAVSSGTDTGDYFGTRLRRFRYWSNRDTVADPEPTTAGYNGDQTRFSNSWMITCSVDGTYDYPDGAKRLAVKRADLNAAGDGKVDGTSRYEVYRLGGVTAAPVLEWAAPVNGFGDTDLQGWTLYNNRIYSLTGRHGQENHRIWIDTPDSVTNPVYTSNSMTQSPAIKQNVPSTIRDAEPEGIGTYQPTAGVVGLYYGEASDNTTRKNSILYHTTT